MTRDMITNNQNAVDDMLADLDLHADDVAAVRTVLDDIASMADVVPEPSPDVRALLAGAVPLRARRRAGIVAAAAGALALGGVSAAAAANRLPDPVQEIVADATEGVLPIDVPHPVKPINPPHDAPGHVKDKPKAPDSEPPKPPNTTAPGQIQKSTKPDPKAPGPAHPADPGSHGRAHNADKSTGSDEKSDDSGDAEISEKSGKSSKNKPEKD